MFVSGFLVPKTDPIAVAVGIELAKLAVADGGGLDIRAPIARVSDAVQTRGDMVVIEAAAEDDAVALLDDLENLGLEHGACSD